MAKFVALYTAPAAMIAEWNAAPPEDAAAGMAEWMAWADTQKAAITDLGNPLGKTLRLTSEGTEDIKNELVGYTIVEADSHADAAKIFAGNPHLKFPGAAVEIIEAVNLPGME